MAKVMDSQAVQPGRPGRWPPGACGHLVPDRLPSLGC